MLHQPLHDVRQSIRREPFDGRRATERWPCSALGAIAASACPPMRHSGQRLRCIEVRSVGAASEMLEISRAAAGFMEV
jgi:hypothetical protein